MHRGYRYLSSLLLGAALAAPAAMMAVASPQDDRNHEKRERENDKRYYDKGHKDYHNWDANEGRSYRRYQTERHQKRTFGRLNHRQQTSYWNWRHSNPDNR